MTVHPSVSWNVFECFIIFFLDSKSSKGGQIHFQSWAWSRFHGGVMGYIIQQL